MTDIITEFLNSIDAVSVGFSQKAFQSLAAEINSISRIILVLYFVIWGYQVFFRNQTGSPLEAAEKIFKVMTIYVIATHWDIFAVLAYDIATKVPNSVGNVILNSVGGNIQPDGYAVTNALNKIYDAGISLQQSIYVGSFFDVLGALLAAMVLVAMLGFTCICVAIIVVNKLIIVISISIAPIIIILAMYHRVSFYLDGYIRLITGAMIASILIYSFLGFYSFIINETVRFALDTTPGESIRIKQIIPFLLMCIVGFYCVLEVQGMAATITGGQATGIGNGRRMALAAMGLTGATALVVMDKVRQSAKGGSKSDATSGGALRDGRRTSAQHLANSLKKSGTTA